MKRLNCQHHGYDSDLTSNGTGTFTYRSDNLMVSASGGVTLSYDPAARLSEVPPGGTTRFACDGPRLVLERDASNALQRRYVHGPGVDEPIAQYDAAGNRTFWLADERGSIIAPADGAGTVFAVNRYDEYGVPDAGNQGRFQYTGQAWLPELGLYYYRARMYDPRIGRFIQVDPIGYEGGPNLYAYVTGDPVNRTDPTGTIGLLGRCPAGSRCEANGVDTDAAGMSMNLALRDAFRALPTDRAVSGPSLSKQPGANYYGDTFGSGPTIGRPIPGLYPVGRVNSSGVGSFNEGIRDIDMLAQLNGVPPLGTQPSFPLVMVMGVASFSPAGIPLPVGGGWTVSYNRGTGWTTFSFGRGWAFRYNADPRLSSNIGVDIPSGTMLPGGRVYLGLGPESIHYR